MGGTPRLGEGGGGGGRIWGLPHEAVPNVFFGTAPPTLLALLLDLSEHFLGALVGLDVGFGTPSGIPLGGDGLQHCLCFRNSPLFHEADAEVAHLVGVRLDGKCLSGEGKKDRTGEMSGRREGGEMGRCRLLYCRILHGRGN